MIAANIMTKDVFTLEWTSPVSTAVKLFKDKNIRQAPVLDADKTVKCVISPKTIISAILPRYITKGYLKDVKFAPELHQFVDKIDDLKDKCVCDFLCDDTTLDQNYSMVSPETSVMEVAALFVNAEKPISCVLVVDDMERLLGLISPVDVFHRLWEYAENKKD